MARAMKDSGIAWIGEIPEEWEIHRMKSCIESRTPGAWGDEAKGNDGDTICLRIADFDYSRFIFKNVPTDMLTIRNYDSETVERLKLKKGDILIEKSGGGEKTPVGRTVIFDKDYTALYANFMDRIRCSELVIDKWLQYVFVTFYKNNYTINYIKQTTGIQNLDLTAMLANESIPVPSTKIQHRIVAFLDTECARIDAVIEQTRASIEEYKKLKQAVITQAVTKGIRPNRPMKDSGFEWIGEIQSNYRIYRMKHLITEPLMYGANESGIPYEYNLPRYIRITDITMDGKLKDSGKLSLPEDLAKEYLLDDGDVLFARSGATVGKAFIYKKEYGRSAFAGYLIRAKFNGLIIPELLFYYTQSSIYEEWKKQIFIQSTIQNIGADRYNQMPIVVPPIEEQHEILSKIQRKANEIDRLLQDKERLINNLESYKKTLIFEYVTGKKETFKHEEA